MVAHGKRSENLRGLNGTSVSMMVYLGLLLFLDIHRSWNAWLAINARFLLRFITADPFISETPGKLAVWHIAKQVAAGVSKCPNVSHHPTIGDISSPTDIWRWCSKYPKRDIYQPLCCLETLLQPICTLDVLHMEHWWATSSTSDSDVHPLLVKVRSPDNSSFSSQSEHLGQRG